MSLIPNHRYQQVESSFFSPRRSHNRIFKNPLFRSVFIGVVIVVTLWLLYPYYTMVGLLPENRPPFPRPPHPHLPPPGTDNGGKDSGAEKGQEMPIPPPMEEDDSPVFPTGPDWNARREQVKNAYKHALKGYMEHAFPHDELAPVSGRYTNKFNGWGVSLIDSLDTMWIMGLRDEFDRALGHVAGMNFTIPSNKYAAFFETTIRYLGGLLSAHALSGSTILLSRADDLGQKLLPAFNGTLSGLPSYSVDVETGHTDTGWSGTYVLLAEAASCQLEFKYLAKLTGRAEYYKKAENVMSILYNANVTDGLFPDKWNGNTGEPVGSHLSAGASSDSGYEYILKQYLLTGDTKAREQYITSANGIIDHLLYISSNRSLLYATDLYQGVDSLPTHRYEHLTCFLPGLFALGAHTLHLNEKDKKRHMWAAKGLAYTCYISYADQASGLGPDVLQMVNGKRWVDALDDWEKDGKVKAEHPIEGKRDDERIPPGLSEPPNEVWTSPIDWEEKRAKRDYSNASGGYLLRPETIESLFLLWKTTGEEKWRERGWEIFQALEKHSKTEYGYANIASVDYSPFRQDDDMPSWFLAETLKYFYLLFDDSNSLPLDKWVLNTEAHPLPKFTWTEWEKKAYNISY